MPEKKKDVRKGTKFVRQGWNAAGTKLWKTTYEVMDAQPSWRSKPAKESAKPSAKRKTTTKRKPASKAKAPRKSKPASKTKTPAKLPATKKRTTRKRKEK